MALYSGRILVRRGDEINYDPEKLMPGEWALSTDKKIVRICVSPGETIRMATYDAFEEDMEKIKEILATCQSIQEAVIRINTEISQKADAVAEYTAQAKQYRDEAKQFRDEAETFAPSGYSELVENVEKNTVKIDTVIEKADLGIKETASGESIHLTDSADAKVVEFGLYGKAKQKTTTGKNILNNPKTVGTIEQDGLKITVNEDKSITVIGTPTKQIDYDLFGYWGAETVGVPLAKNKIFIKGSGTTSIAVIVVDVNSSRTYNGVDAVIDLNTDTLIHKITLFRYVFKQNETYNTTLYPMIRLSDENGNPIGDDTYEPYTGGKPSPNPNYPQDVEISGASGSVVGKSCGKNLLNLLNGKSATGEGVTMTNRGDGSYTVTGTATGTNGNIWLFGAWNITPNDNNVLFTLKKGKVYIVKDCILFSGTKTKSPGYIHWIDEDFKVTGVRNAQLEVGKTYNEIAYPFVYESDVDDGIWEPYKETSSTIPTPNGLVGIQVDSGGNYADENGQQRVCDVIVKYADGSGEYIRRIEKLLLSLTNNILDASRWTGAKDLYTNYRVYGVNTKKGGAVISNILEVKHPSILWTNDIMGCSLVENNGIDFSIPYSVLSITKSATSEERETALKNYLQTHEIYFWYELAEPIRTPLTAEQIAEIEKLCTFYPETNIYNDADCGMKVKYLADSKNYIDKRLAQIETALVNSI